MTETAKKAAELIEYLPEREQMIVYEFIKKMVLEWDPDYTKLSASEVNDLREAMHGEYVDDSEMDWDTILGKK